MLELATFYRSKEWRKLITIIRAERLNEDGVNICEYCHKPIVKAYDCIGHHKIHDRLGYTKREVFLVYGSPLSGKTTYVESVKMPGDLIVDMDSIWQCVSGCKRYVKPPRLNAVVFKIRDELLDVVKYRVGKWNNAYIIGGYPLEGERARLCAELGAREVYIETSRADAISRLEADKDRDKEEWIKYINNWWNQFEIEHGEPPIE